MLQIALPLLAAVVGFVPPCHNFTGLYSGLNISTSEDGSIASLPVDASSPYARFGAGTGHMQNGNPSSGWTHATMRFEATGNSTWSGQFRGCAELVIGQDKSTKIEIFDGKLHELELITVTINSHS